MEAIKGPMIAQVEDRKGGSRYQTGRNDQWDTSWISRRWNQRPSGPE